MKAMIKYTFILDKKAFPVLLLLIGCLLFSCQDSPVEKVLKAAGSNREELEKVLSHYRQTGEKEKLEAADFLIKNMLYHYSYEGKVVNNFDAVFEIVDSLHKKKVKINYTSDLQMKWDSLVSTYGVPSLAKASIVPDYTTIKAAFLIGNIDAAFKIRDSLALGNKLSFPDFCEYVLPYRVGTERLEAWRTHLYAKSKPQRDTTKARTRLQFTDMSNDALSKYVGSNGVFWSYPFDIPVSKFEKSYYGSCSHQVLYCTMMMRANGLPVCTDQVIRWANRSSGHKWMALLKEDGKWHPFDAANQAFTLEYDQDRWIAKVFRETYSPNVTSLPDVVLRNKYLSKLINPHLKDVTSEYKKVFTVKVPLLGASSEEYLTICTFDNKDWSPVYYGRVSGKEGVFENMGGGVMYVVKNDDGIASQPFLLDTLGKMTFFNSDEKHKQDMVLHRKFPLTTFVRGRMEFMVNCDFEASKEPQFNSPRSLCKVKEVPENFNQQIIHEDDKYRYARLISRKGPTERGAHVAEMEFYGLSENGKDTIRLTGRVFGQDTSAAATKAYPKVTDGDLLTHYGCLNYQTDWVAIDFGKPYRIVKVRYCPRSDENFIESGHRYELTYWKNGEWVSLGNQVAKDQWIKFQRVPSNAIYLLHDLTKGKEERIFTYQGGKQLFW